MATKEEIQRVLDGTREEMENVLSKSSTTRKFAKHNSLLFIITMICTIIYPICVMTIDLLTYVLAWVLVILVFVARVKLFTDVIKYDLQFQACKVIEAQLETEIEKIQKDDNDKFTRDFEAAKLSTKV